ncbi:ATP-binding protein [Metabacillus malikii]|uniref:histidine kinase n=1 Tax=Metabacillus malikii TaxID=1504265 RepID=A0ABT9ZDN3_9BACI|nr:ATP-binding protein [Metabacillus malikii]MDQ0230371.1 signal transduction histidine kinase [Metabacillus malikii]
MECIVQNRDKILIFTNLLVLCVGIISWHLHIYILFLIVLIFSGILQIVFLINRKRQGFNMLMIQGVPLPVIITKNGKIINVNEHMLQLISIKDSGKVIGKNIEEFFRFKSGKQHQFPASAPVQQVGTLLCGNGEEIAIELISNRLQEKSSKTTEYHIIQDISHILEKEKRLQHSEQLSVIGELAAGIAHEIRNPLTSLKGFLQLSATSNHGMYNHIMLQEINRINSIVGELLLLSKPKEMDYKPCNVMKIIHHVVTIVNTQAILYNIEIKTNYHEEIEELEVYCEENKIKQVFINLLKNAIEAMQKQGTINIYLEKNHQNVQITFQDQGKGITEEELQHIGKRFYTTKEEGTGLGLMICYNIIEKHNGQIHVESEIGKGTSFIVTLPVK